MESDDKKKIATARQVAYIQVLKQDLGVESLKLAKDLSVEGASRVIESLLSRMTDTPNRDKPGQAARINEPRLGMAMKECFRLWKANGHDIHEKRRKWFKEDVIKTYWLFTEIAEVVAQKRKRIAIED